VRRVLIPKPAGGQRPLGIGTIRDRVAQMAVVLVLEPIFEADLEPEQFGYRPGRSPLDAVRQVEQLLTTGHTEVVDADLSGYFDSIPHPGLLRSLSRRIGDKQLLGLIRMWLEAPVQETDASGQRRRTTRNRDERRGTPQGSPLSPLLSNIYMRRFVRGWKTGGHQHRLNAHVVVFADDFLLCTRGTASKAMVAMRRVMNQLKLTVNESKTRICRLPDETFDFLGYQFGGSHDPDTGEFSIEIRPSTRSIARITRAIRDATSRRWLPTDIDARVTRLNQILQGWANYFCLGPVGAMYRALDHHARLRLQEWLELTSRGTAPFSDEYLHDVLGLTRLSDRAGFVPAAGILNLENTRPGQLQVSEKEESPGVRHGLGMDRAARQDSCGSRAPSSETDPSEQLYGFSIFSPGEERSLR
jgi:group II intron reverse transcriptase/maturase